MPLSQVLSASSWYTKYCPMPWFGVSQKGHSFQKPNAFEPGSKLSAPPFSTGGSSAKWLACAMRKSSVRDAALPEAYQPLMLTGSKSGPKEPSSCNVTGPSPAFMKDWMAISSPAMGTGGRSFLLGSGFPAFTGMLCTSKIHWRDGSVPAGMASPPSGTFVVPAEPATSSEACETPAVPLKLTVSVTEAPAARSIGTVAPETEKAPAPLPETFRLCKLTVLAPAFCRVSWADFAAPGVVPITIRSGFAVSGDAVPPSGVPLSGRHDAPVQPPSGVPLSGGGLFPPSPPVPPPLPLQLAASPRATTTPSIPALFMVLLRQPFPRPVGAR